MTTLAQLKRRLATVKAWYHQAGATKPLYLGFPWMACFFLTAFGRRLPFNFQGIQTVLRRDFMDCYYDQRLLQRVADYYTQRHKRDPNFLKRLKRWWDQCYVAPLRQQAQQLNRVNLDRLGNQEVRQTFHAFAELYQASWREAFFLDAFDFASDGILAAAISAEGKSLQPTVLNQLIAPVTLSWVQRERRDFFTLVAAARRNQRLARAIKRGIPIAKLRAAFPAFARRLETHAAVYHWITNDYADIRRLPFSYFLRQLRQLLAEPATERAERPRIAAVLTAATAKRRLYHTLNLSSRFVRTVEFLVQLAAWRDDRKATSQWINACLYQFAGTLQRRFGWPLHDIEQLFWWEVPTLFVHRPVSRLQFRQRFQGVYAFGPPNRPDNFFTGRSAAALARFLAVRTAATGVLRGQSAYPGIVHGTVKLIRSQREFGIMRRGDILVAPNTRPEYMPIIKIAKAIVTEEGGLTCHAAIVSRELHVPCIVGIQGICRALHDGDRVEVDATRGIVTKV